MGPRFTQKIHLRAGFLSQYIDPKNNKKNPFQCYFFTVEFGLSIEKQNLKIYGAGLLSSSAEMKHVIHGIRSNSICIDKFDIDVATETPCIVTDFQKRYFYTKNIEEAKKEIR